MLQLWVSGTADPASYKFLGHGKGSLLEIGDRKRAGSANTLS